MSTSIREYNDADLPGMRRIWNQVVEDGIAFPQMEPLDEAGAKAFFAEQTYCGVAETDGNVLGLYILHPNNIGRCGHIGNTSYAVDPAQRGKGIGELLVRDSLVAAKRLGFRLMQFNAVVASNTYALRLYEKLGFTRLGLIPGGFMMKDGHYEDMYPMIKEL